MSTALFFSSSQMTASEKTLKLYEKLSVDDIDTIQKHFREQKSNGLSYDDFRSLLGNFNIDYTDDVFYNFCLKIDSERDNVINWSEFTSYFILELQNDDDTNEERLSTIPPIPKSTSVLSTIHRSNVVKVLYMTMSGANTSNGYYVTVGCYGDLYFWTSKWKHEAIYHADKVPEVSSFSPLTESESYDKKDSKTLILSAVAMSDVEIICISSVCCDLRFYDVSSASKFNLRLYITNFPSPFNSFYYHCAGDDNDKNAKLILGDMVGSVRVIYFTNNFKRKFREGTVTRQIFHDDLMKGKYETMACEEFLDIHSDVVRQVLFCESLSSFISACESTITKSAYLPSVIIGNLGARETQIVFRMNSGTTCFDFDESSQTLATGGPDCVIRLWNPITPNQPKAIFSGGHNSGILHIFMQDAGAKIYSMDKNKIIKVWDAVRQSLLQTFTGFKTLFPESISINAFYNDTLREFIVASKKISTIKCHPKINLDVTDGFTDFSSISVILLNRLYNFLVTCSVSSTIIIWDVWKGRKVNLISRAHTRLKHGEIQLVAIATGCFDPNHQFLLTAGGTTLKVWNFNEGFCLRTINMEVSQNVHQVFWGNERIFVFSHNVVEFNDDNDCKQQINIGKTWRDCHPGDIICASVLEPYAVVTSCTSGDLIFWRFETGQPYLRFNLYLPSHQLQVIFIKKKVAKMPVAGNKKENKTSKLVGKSQSLPEFLKQGPTSQCMISLCNRPVDISNGTLLVSLSSGRVQVWSHHEAVQRYITDFNAIHVAGDVITAMTTDTQNCYLFTGSARGYIKTWMIVNFCLSTTTVEKISQVKLRKQFPFLIRDDLEGRAKRSVRTQREPQLLNSYQGHKKSITSLVYSQDNEVLISASSDKSVRLWHLSGQYIGTIGSPIDWRCPSPNKPPPYDYVYRFPADLKHVISYTTLKVLEGGNIPSLLSRNANELRLMDKEADTELSEITSTDATKSYHQILRQVPSKKDAKDDVHGRYEKPTLDISLPHIPVYSHLRIHPTVAINLPQMIPKCLETNNLPNLQYIFLEPDDLKTE